MKTFTESLILLLSYPPIIKLNPKLLAFLLDLYEKRSKFWNFGLIGLIGMCINQIVMHTLITYLPLWIANSFAILTAWIWNYTNAAGSWTTYWG